MQPANGNLCFLLLIKKLPSSAKSIAPKTLSESRIQGEIDSFVGSPVEVITESSNELIPDSLIVSELIDESINNSPLELEADSESTGEVDSKLLDEDVAIQEVSDSELDSKSKPSSLIHTALAKRLQEKTSTLSKWKKRDIFPSWSKERDPEHIVWRWDAETKLFVPVDE